jgi:XisI protein
MDKLVRYRQTIKKILLEYRDWAAGGNLAGVEECVSFDEVRDQYLWFSVGWDGKRRDFSVTVYMRIVQGKIWVEEDWTKQGMVDELLEMGVPAEDIVLGFQHPSKRPLTEFAVA